MSTLHHLIHLAATTIEEAVHDIPGQDADYDSSKFVITIFNFVYAVAGLVAVAFIVYGAVNYSMTQGDPGKIRQAHQTLTYAIVGLLVVLIATALTNFIIGNAAFGG